LLKASLATTTSELAFGVAMYLCLIFMNNQLTYLHAQFRRWVSIEACGGRMARCWRDQRLGHHVRVKHVRRVVAN
jgi:hypothetical protein